MADDKIQMRRDTAANWTSQNPTLSAGEIGFETDTGELKVGDGSTVWTSLGYFQPGGSYMEARHYKTTSGQSYTSGTHTDMTFDASDGDTLGITPGTGNRTIPAAFNGWRMRLFAQVDHGGGVQLESMFRFYLNSTLISEISPGNSGWTNAGLGGFSPWVTVATSDTFKVTARFNSTITGGTDYGQWMQIEFRKPAP